MDKIKFKCKKCGCDSEMDISDKYSHNVREHCHYLGLCGSKCYYDMKRHERNLLEFETYIKEIIDRNK